MSRVDFRRFLSFLCCICFISSFVTHMSKNIVFADNTCTINVMGHDSVSDKYYNYKTDGQSSGKMSVIYQPANSATPMECTPGADGKITGIPADATVIFCLEPEDGFIPKLQIDGQDRPTLPQSENLYVSSTSAGSGGISAQASFIKSDDANIVLNLKCVVNEALQSATYDDSFKSTWSTIEYSTDGGTEYKDLSHGPTPGTDGKYTFDSSINEIKLKFTWTNDVMGVLDQTLLQSGSEVTVGKGDHTAIFREAVYTLSWAYQAAELDESLLTTNGKISVEPGDGIEGTENESGGAYVVQPGTEVTIHLIPDYGYQFAKGTIGEDVEVEPSESQSTFTFTMPKEQVVVGNIFTAHSDEVTTMSDLVVSGNISGADKIIDSGNASLTISDSVITADEKSKINSFASENGLEPVAYLDLELSNFLLKGNTGDKWENMLTNTGSPVGISLNLAENLRNYDSYSVIKVHGNDISVVNTNYNSSEGILNFETDSFSTYVIAKKSNSSNGIFSAGNLKTGDQSKLWVYSLMITASIAGFIYSFRIRREKHIL